MIRVLVADDDDLLRDAVVDVLQADGRFEVLAAVPDAATAVDEALRLKPDVALVDVRMPGGGGHRVARDLREASAPTRVVALSSHDDRDAVVDMFRSGAVSYLVKGEATNEEIVRTLLDVTTGRVTLPRSIGRQVLEEFSTQLERAYQEEQRLRTAETRVRRVLAAADVEIVFQPIFSLHDGRRVGVEALSRFPAEPRQGPDRWFADAAAVGLGTQLELLAIRTAMATLPLLDDDSYVALNVSPTTATDPDFQRIVLAGSPGRIVMEVTEHAPIDDYDEFQRSIEPLRAAGVRLAVDDAGAGFASLRHIVSLAPDTLKLDLSLCRDIDVHQPRRAMARALISFAAESGATIVAEGIERRAELDVLRSLEAATAQGYLLGRPVALEDLPTTWAVPDWG